jgi:hypothetical protein
MKFEIERTEIFDNTYEDDEGNVQPSEISVGVWVRVENKLYCLEFQTTLTLDYGSYCQSLEAYETIDYEKLSNLFDYEDDFLEFIDNIKDEADPETSWSNYVNKNYHLNDDHFGGMDSNSCINEAKRRD